MSEAGLLKDEHLRMKRGANARGGTREGALSACDGQRLVYQLLQEGLKRQREENANPRWAVSRGEVEVGETALETVRPQVLL